jgi:prepilin-type N-terminal cleavage/methylation domain-containing protein
MKTASFTSRNKGFTVLEFLVVMFIMGILIALVLAGFTRARERARDETRIAGVQNIALALQEYRAICGNYPATLNLDDDQYCGRSATQTLQLGEILSFLPDLPDDTENYLYAGIAPASGSSIKCTAYHLGIVLENENNGFLQEDDDAASVLSTELCDNSDSDFDGDNDGTTRIYDFRN